jgi:hypothetical protein
MVEGKIKDFIERKGHRAMVTPFIRTSLIIIPMGLKFPYVPLDLVLSEPPL